MIFNEDLFPKLMKIAGNIVQFSIPFNGSPTVPISRVDALLQSLDRLSSVLS